jgi:hypothetical protein
MAHLGWTFQVVGYLGTFLAGILAALYGPLFKYSVGQANDLRNLIVEIRQFISAGSAAGKIQPSKWGGQAATSYSSSLKTKLELIRGYDCIRHLRLAPLPPKQNVYRAAEKLPNFLYAASQ